MTEVCTLAEATAAQNIEKISLWKEKNWIKVQTDCIVWCLCSLLIAHCVILFGKIVL